MENASRALVMAGGVLLALMIVAVLLYTVNSAASMKNAEEEQLKQEQIVEFNKEYESYQKSLMRGTDVISVCNKVIDYNEKNIDKPLYHIKVKLTLTTNKDTMLDKDEVKTILKQNQQYVIDSKNSIQYNAIFENKDVLFMFKRRFFKCTEIKYNKDTSLVNELTFVEVDIGEVIKD